MDNSDSNNNEDYQKLVKEFNNIENLIEKKEKELTELEKKRDKIISKIELLLNNKN